MHAALTLALLVLGSTASQALPWPSHTIKKSFSLPLRRTRTATSSEVRRVRKRGSYSGGTGLGDFLDLFYTVPVTVGGVQTSVNLDTGSSDFWVITTDCKSVSCLTANGTKPYPASSVQSPIAGKTVPIDLAYGDSLTGTHAGGQVAMDTAIVADLSLENQVFGAVTDTNNTSIDSGASGIIGLGFPSESFVQAAVVNSKFNNPLTTDDFLESIATDGPLLSRLSMSGYLEQPMFTVTLQRDIIEVSGSDGQLTVGKLPDGVDNSSLTWVPVRLYKPVDGGLNPPTFAPDEIYPLRWEVPLDAVYFDGNRLDNGATGVTALVDTGNSLLRGPAAIVDSVYSAVSPAFAANKNVVPTYPCATPHNISFQFGGKVFPIDPSDFVVQNQTGDATTCVPSNIVGTDAPGFGALFSWSLGDPFFKSNLVAFYYGNLTHPSVDPPRIGFMSTVPADADARLAAAVSSAAVNGGVFQSTSQAAPTSVPTDASSAPASATVVSIPAPLSTDSSSGTSAAQANPSSNSRTSAAPTLRADAVCILLAVFWVLTAL